MGYHSLLKEMFVAKEAPYDDIHEEDWLCLDCLEGFIKHYLCAWWLDWKRADGRVIERDCWFGKSFWNAFNPDVVSESRVLIGWNCRTMTHRPAHASKLNVSQNSCKEIMFLTCGYLFVAFVCGYSWRPSGLTVTNGLSFPTLSLVKLS